MDYRRVTTKDWLKTGTCILLTMGVFVVSTLLLGEAGTPGVIVAVALFTGAMFLLIRWHAHSTVYRCPACSHAFTISVLTDLVSPHVLNRAYLKCPQCHRRRWAEVHMRADA